MAGEVVADYEFYSDVFGGTLSEAAFYDCLPKSLKHVQWLTNYREPFGACEIRKYKRAICAAVEAFSDYGDGAIGFTLGNFKTNVRDGVSFSAEDRATEAALRELGQSNLGFCGVC